MRKTQKGFTLIELLIVLAIIGIFASMLLSALRAVKHRQPTVNTPVVSNAPQPVVTKPFVVPEVSTATKKSEGPLLDMATVNQSNPGYNLDMDGDGIPDHTILKSDGILYYAKGASDGTFGAEIPVLVIHGNLSAYCVFLDVNPQGKQMPKVRFFDDQRRGFYQWGLGTTAEGIPYFGDVEGD